MYNISQTILLFWCVQKCGGCIYLCKIDPKNLPQMLPLNIWALSGVWFVLARDNRWKDECQPPHSTSDHVDGGEAAVIQLWYRISTDFVFDHFLFSLSDRWRSSSCSYTVPTKASHAFHYSKIPTSYVGIKGSWLFITAWNSVWYSCCWLMAGHRRHLHRLMWLMFPPVFSLFFTSGALGIGGISVTCPWPAARWSFTVG